MGVTVIVNSMTVSHKGSSGMSIAFPDICKTPILGVPVPIPYPNIAMSSDLKKGSKKVKCDKKKVILKSSEIKRSMGDEVGVQKGLISNEQMGKGKFANYSFDVKFEGKNVCRLLDPTTQNRSSLNTAAFAHLQKPGVVTAGAAKHVEDACSEVEKKNEAEAKQEEAGAKGSSAEDAGVLDAHWSRMKKALNEDMTENWMVYFRNTGKWPTKNGWINDRGDHEPKPHEWTDGTSCKEERVDDQKRAMSAWLVSEQRPENEKPEKPEISMLVEMGACRRASHAAKSPALPSDMKKLYGVIISMNNGYGRGRPILGVRKWGGIDFSGKWMTGDYDLMDIMREDAVCTRPGRAAFGNLKYVLNWRMGWPGIQHPPQATWNTAQDKSAEFLGERHFSIAANIQSWLKSSAGESREKKNDVPKKNIVAPNKSGGGGRNLKMIDNDLTVMTGTGGLHLKEAADYWDVLVCCGCLDKGTKVKTTNLEMDSTAARLEEDLYRGTEHKWADEKTNG